MKHSALSESFSSHKQLNVLIIEDSEIDAELMVRELQRFGYALSWRRVDGAMDLKQALFSRSWDVVLSDYSMPHLSGLEALEIVKSSRLDVPFVLVSGTIGEETAVKAMRAGANDYLLKDRMARLGPAVERELREAEGRRARKRAEDALRASEERLRLAWETTPDALTISRVEDGAYVDVNQGYVDLTGYSRLDVIGRSALELSFWEDSGHRHVLVNHLIKHGHVRNLQAKMRRKDGEVRTVLISAGLMRLQGRPHILEVVKDIEALKRAQQALAKSEQLFRKYFELGLVGMALTSPEQKWVCVNERICRILGFTRDELLQTTWSSLTHQDDLKSDLEQFDRMLTGEIEGYALDKRFIRKDGGVVYATVHVSCIRGEDQRVEHVIAHLHDISGRIHSEQILTKHAQELETINRLGREISSSLSLEQVSTRGLRELCIGLQSDCAMLFLRKDHGLILQDWAWNSDKSENVQFPIHRAGKCLCDQAVEERTAVFSSNINNDPRCTGGECKRMGLASVAAIPLFSGDQTIGVLGLGSYSQREFSAEATFIQSLAHEITLGLRNSLLFEEIQRHARELEEGLLELELANEEKDNLQNQLVQAQKMEAIGILSGGIAHDFNNLLQVIEGYSDLALFKTQPGENGYQQLKEIKKAAQRAAELTKGLLTFGSRVESKLRPVNVNHEIHQVAGMLSRTIPKMIDMQISLEEHIPTIDADASQLQQVLMNLALNARDAMPEGGTLTIRTENLELDVDHCRKHLGTKPGPHVLISVSDSGSGMDQKTKDLIFDPFFTTKEAGKGTGLGLSIAYGIVKSHGGHIVCRSRPGEGTSFRIYLPILVDGTITDLEMPETETLMGGTETVLIIEDEDKIRDVAAEMLSSFGYKILTATNGKEGLRYYREKADNIDIVLLDVIMPEMGGIECLREILRMDPAARVLIASGCDAAGTTVQEVSERGARGIVTKPFSMRHLLKAVRDALDGT